MNAHRDAILRLLESHVMFNTLAEGDAKSLAGLFEVQVFEARAVIARQHTPISGMYSISEGRVRVKETREGRRERIGDFDRHSGATFGELSLVRECHWEFQLEAVEEAVTALFLPAERIRELTASRTDLSAMFKRHIGKIVISHRLAAMLGPADCGPETFSAILDNLGVKKIPKGSPIFAQAQADPRLYMIEAGTVDLVLDSKEEKLVLDRCRAGEMIGEGAALADLSEGGNQPFSALAVTDVVVLVVRQPEVKKILALNPALAGALRERAQYLAKVRQTEISAASRSNLRDTRLAITDGITEEEFSAMEREKPDTGKIPVVRQSDPSECGAACLTMITRFYDKDFTLGQIRELTGLSVANDSPMSIITGAESLGFSARAHALTVKELETAKLPGIIGWEGSHYAVVYKVGRKRIRVVDPAEGEKSIRISEFLTGWTTAAIPGADTGEDRGLFIGLNPTAKFKSLEPPEKPIYHFINYLLPFKIYFLEAMVAAMTINLLGLASPLFIQTIVDTVVVHKDVSLLNMMLAGMVLVTVMTTATRVVQSLLIAHTTARVDMTMMSEFYRHILSLPMGFFLSRNKGEILARFGENAKIRAIITGSSITVILNTLMLLVYFLMMFGYNTHLTMIVIAFIPGYVLLILYFTPRIKAISQQIFLTNSQAQSYLIESLNGIETLKATANEYMARARWENAFVENVNNAFRQQRLTLTSNSLHGLLTLGTNVMILWVGASQVIENRMSIGELMGFNMLVGLVMGPVQQMVQLWNQLQEIRISIDRVSDVLNVKPEQEAISSPDRMPAMLAACQGGIEFHKVDFSYMAGGKENLVMKGFDLTIAPGMNVAFVGASGCGKSTIAKMVLGFNMPKSGECRIDGKSILDLDLKSLRRHIGVVMQDSFLVSGTVAENIALGDPEPDLQIVKKAAILAGVDAEILRWPLGYQTAIGEKGMGISGGQRQRVCIARALYHQPKILIFDEATSALDNESEKAIQKNMVDILKGRTSITIAHRLSTILSADMICFIENGQVAEKGRHQDLIDAAYLRENGYAGRYYNLARDQFGLQPLEL